MFTSLEEGRNWSNVHGLHIILFLIQRQVSDLSQCFSTWGGEVATCLPFLSGEVHLRHLLLPPSRGQGQSHVFQFYTLGLWGGPSS